MCILGATDNGLSTYILAPMRMSWIEFMTLGFSLVQPQQFVDIRGVNQCMKDLFLSVFQIKKVGKLKALSCQTVNLLLQAFR